MNKAAVLNSLTISNLRNVLQKTANGDVKSHVSGGKRPWIANRKATFHKMTFDL